MNRLLLISLIFFLAGCEKISFREPQPKDKKVLPSVPRELQGKYLLVGESFESSRDTLIIHERGFRIGFYDPEERNAEDQGDYASGTLSDSLILKTHKGYYFANFNERPEWELRVLKLDKNGNLLFLSPEIKNMRFADYIKKLNSEIKVDTVRVGGETLYQIDPKAKQLLKLIKKGYFTGITLPRVN